MKTIRNSILLMFTCCAFLYSGAQLNLGLQSTTRAAVNTAFISTMVSKATVATTQATRSVMNINASGVVTTSEVATSTKKLAHESADVSMSDNAPGTFSLSAGNSSSTDQHVATNQTVKNTTADQSKSIVGNTKKDISATNGMVANKTSAGFTTGNSTVGNSTQKVDSHITSTTISTNTSTTASTSTSISKQ